MRPLAAALAWVLLLAVPGGAAAEGAEPAPPPALELATEATPDAGAGTGLRAEPPARAEARPSEFWAEPMGLNSSGRLMPWERDGGAGLPAVCWLCPVMMRL